MHACMNYMCMSCKGGGQRGGEFSSIRCKQNKIKEGMTLGNAMCARMQKKPACRAIKHRKNTRGKNTPTRNFFVKKTSFFDKTAPSPKTPPRKQISVLTFSFICFSAPGSYAFLYVWRTVPCAV